MQGTVGGFHQSRSSERLRIQFSRVLTVFVVKWFDDCAGHKEMLGGEKERVLRIFCRFKGRFAAAGTVDEQGWIKKIFDRRLPSDLP